MLKKHAPMRAGAELSCFCSIGFQQDFSAQLGGSWAPLGLYFEVLGCDEQSSDCSELEVLLRQAVLYDFVVSIHEVDCLIDHSPVLNSHLLADFEQPVDK